MSFYGLTPSPRKLARRLHPEILGALCTATMTQEGFAIRPDMHGTLNFYGLVDGRKPLLSAFGLSVRRAAQERSE